jgi:hypothetical protein
LVLTIVWADDSDVISLASVNAVRSTKAAAKAVMSADAMACASARSSTGMALSTSSRLTNATTRAMAKQPRTSTHTDWEVTHSIATRL